MISLTPLATRFASSERSRFRSLAGLAMALTVFIGSSAQSSAAIVLWSEDFSGGATSILGTTTATGALQTGSVAWVGNAGINSDGTNFERGIAFLPFTPDAGQTYTLSANITHTASDFATLGFSEANSGARILDPGVVAGPWVFQTGTLIRSFSGPGTGGEVDLIDNRDSSFVTTNDLDIVLTTDATGTGYQAEWLVNGVSERTATGTDFADFNWISVGTNDRSAAVVNSLSLTQAVAVPEPSSMVFLAFIGGPMLLRRRRS